MSRRMASSRRIGGIALIVAVVVGALVAFKLISRREGTKPVASGTQPAPIPTRSQPAPEPPKAPEKPPALPPYIDVDATSLEEQRRVLLTNMQQQLAIPEAQLTKLA